jgi:hypothetical protein
MHVPLRGSRTWSLSVPSALTLRTSWLLCKLVQTSP